jgi:hypothetical protein
MILVRLFEFEVPKRVCRDMIGTSNSATSRAMILVPLFDLKFFYTAGTQIGGTTACPAKAGTGFAKKDMLKQSDRAG